MKKLYYLLIGIVLVLGLASTIVAAAPDNVLEPILQAVESFHVAENYEKYHLAVDFIIYLIIFVGVGRTTLGKKLGNGPAVGIGLILAVGLTAFEAKLGYAVYDFGFIGAIIIAFLLGLFIYKMITDNGGNALTAFAIAYLLIYTLLQKSLLDIMDKYPLIYGIMSLVFIICLFKVIMSVFGLFKGGSFPSFGGGHIGGNRNTPEDIRTRDDARNEERKAEKARKEAEKTEKNDKVLRSLTRQLENINDELINLEKIKNDLEKKELLQVEEEIKLLEETKLQIQRLSEQQQIVKKVLNMMAR